MFCFRRVAAAAILAAWFPATSADAREYLVGPEQEFARPELVPWELLAAGDIVSIYWRSEPYHAKWVVACRGTEERPVIIRGRPGPEGALPILEADGALQPPQLDFWSGQRAIIKIGGSNNPPDNMPAHIVIEGLDLRGARPGHHFFGRSGLTEYSDSASAIFIEKGEQITIRSCRMHDCANGFFTAAESREILVEGCRIFDNGIEGSGYQHNSYTESAGITFQFNQFGPLRADCGGTNLKDRSAGTVIRYNIIEGGNRQLDLVESQEGDDIKRDPRYQSAFVYGNLLIEPDNAGNNQIVHFGGDSGPEEDFRNGPLWFFNNTVISRRTGTTTLLRLSTPRGNAEVFNNVVFIDAPGDQLGILDETGFVKLHHNCLKPGWKTSQEADATASVAAAENVESARFGFRNPAENDFRLGEQSPAVNRGAVLPAIVAKDHPLKWEIVLPHSFRHRPDDGRIDLGAFESP